MLVLEAAGVIASFGDKATEALFHGTPRKAFLGFPSDLLRAARRKLDMLNAAIALNDLRPPPGNRLEALGGDLSGLHSIRINDQWRLVFRWAGSEAFDVRMLDYH